MSPAASSPFLATMADRPGLARAGGKGEGLYRLLDLGLHVPEFAVLTAEAFQTICPHGRVPDAAPPKLEQVLGQAWELLGSGETPLAVRSSAVEEDGVERSYAGQMETVLNVRERAEFTKAVLHCWRSLSGERARAYRAAATSMNDPSDAAMALVLQRMVEPDAAGVLFTVNAPDGRADEVLVSSVWGLGEGLVSGELDADVFVLDRAGRVLKRQVADKAEMVASAASGGTERRLTPHGQRHEPSLVDEVLAELAASGLRAEARAGRPLDMEFAVQGGTVYYLQARPVTGFRPRTRASDGQRLVWSNANIIESYPGITSPLTFSFIRRAYHAVYLQFCELLGLRARQVRRLDPMLRNMLGLIRGRVYYNLLNWYGLVSLLPGFRFNKGFMEAMMGLEAPQDAGQEAVSRSRKYFRELPKLLGTGLNAVWLHLTLDRRIRRFHRDFARAHARFAALDYDALQPHEILAAYRDMEQAVLWRWKAPIINDFEAMIFYGLLKRLTLKWGVDPEGSLQNALVGGQGDVESVEVSAKLMELAEIAAQDKELKARLLAATPAGALEIVRNHAELGPLLEAYLRKYGDRAVAELKLESRTMRDDPAFCMAMLQNGLRAMERGGHAPRSAGSRRDAEVELARRMRSPLKRLVYRWVLKHARKAVRNRENQRLARTRAYGVARRMVRALGAWLARNGFLESGKDVFFLTLEEVFAFIEGTAASTNLRALVAQRKLEYAEFHARPPLPDVFTTFGPVHGGNDFTAKDPTPAPGDALRGLGACPGVVEGTALVLHEPDASLALNGEILVAPQTDPGWVVLFPSVSGLVVERGSMLSHSAIVAREMGIPAVVGVRGATSAIKSGDRVRLDGAAGTVVVVSDADTGKDEDGDA